MNKSIWQPFIYALLIVVGIIMGMWLKPDTNGGAFLFKSKNKIGQILNIINEAYVDPVDVDSLEEVAINELLTQLDPHSVYIPAKDLQQANEGLEGNFEGVGIEFSILDDTIMVANVLKDGPASKVGILPGDRIIKVDTANVASIGIQNEQVFKLLRGAAGTKELVQLFRPDGKRKVSYNISRGQIPIYSVDAALMLNNQTGYIKIERFAASTHQEFVDALEKLQSQQMKNLVLDLRNNPGGYLSAATDIADEFLNDKKLIVYTEGRTQRRAEYRAENPGNFESGKLIVLIDEGSASASEIVSGAVQDWDRGVILGRRSFGKGLVQEPFQLQDGSAIRLTVSRYYTPAGRCIQKDYTNGVEAYEHEISNRYEDGEVNDETKLKITDSTTYKTDKGRTVYGGGGIMPDVFVAVDTSYINKFYAALFEQSLLSRFTYNYMDANRKSLTTTYKNAASFNASFYVNDILWNKFVNYIKQNSTIDFSTQELVQSEKHVRLLLKAMIARQVWRDEGYYTVLSSEDKMIRKAIETFSSNYNKLLKP
jgi:carboxyl-terminal processing protease